MTLLDTVRKPFHEIPLYDECCNTASEFSNFIRLKGMNYNGMKNVLSEMNCSMNTLFITGSSLVHPLSDG
jgi:hypothetical protein